MLEPFSWRDRPSLIEVLFPVQKISVESYKEQMAGSGKTLTALGSYWKGRKPLILNKACILGALLPVSNDNLKDLEMFEKLMAMDADALWFRLQEKNAKIPEYFAKNRRSDSDLIGYKAWVEASARPEECGDDLFAPIWDAVNAHLGTNAQSFPELVEQMGIARFGHRPKVADVFSGSGQIPFEAARLGCDVYASDLNPIACMLTWGAFNIVGAQPEKRKEIEKAQKELAQKVQAEIDALEVETDGKGWRAKAFLYCVEVKCPETGWMVPLLPSLVISQPRTGERNNVIVQLLPNQQSKSYDIKILEWASPEQMEQAAKGTIQGGEIIHSPDGKAVYRTKISTIRGDYKDGNDNRNRLRLWEKSDFVPRPDDIYQERLYCIQWIRPKTDSNRDEYQFRSVTDDDLAREKKVIDYVGSNLGAWQEKGWVPDMVIEPGDKTDEPIRTRGWTYWHHLFNARQLLVAGTARKYMSSLSSISFAQSVNWNSRISHWSPLDGGGGSVKQVFYNQALNTFYNYGCRATNYLQGLYIASYFNFPISGNTAVNSQPAETHNTQNDIYITDPPYGDAVKYEEITEFFIAWLRKNPPPEFAHWTWDSRRALAVKGEDEGFRQGMIAAYTAMAKHMPDNGIQVLMFTHQSGSIWADMTNIIWASGLQVTAAWYVVTETDSALRQGANVTGTIMLVLRKRTKELSTFRDDLGWEIEAAVKAQVESLTGLDRTVRERGSQGLYNDADLQMAGYAAALKVLTAYTHIDGKDMVVESKAPKVQGRKTFVEELIDFAVQTAVQFLVPTAFDKAEWQKLEPVERFYLKMVEMEFMGNKTLDNYQNMAKAFKVRHFDQLMSDNSKANSARLRGASELKSSLMSGDAEIAGTPLRALLYAIYEVTKEVEIDDILLHLMQNCANYLQVKPTLVKMASYLASMRTGLKATKTFAPDQEASASRVIAEALQNQRI